MVPGENDAGFGKNGTSDLQRLFVVVALLHGRFIAYLPVMAVLKIGWNNQYIPCQILVYLVAYRIAISSKLEKGARGSKQS